MESTQLRDAIRGAIQTLQRYSRPGAAITSQRIASIVIAEHAGLTRHDVRREIRRPWFVWVDGVPRGGASGWRVAE